MAPSSPVVSQNLSHLGWGLTALLLGACGGSNERCLDLVVDAPTGVQGIAYVRAYNADGSDRTGGAWRVPTTAVDRTCSEGGDLDTSAWVAEAWVAEESELRAACQDPFGETCQPQAEDLRGSTTFTLQEGVTTVHISVARTAAP